MHFALHAIVIGPVKMRISTADIGVDSDKIRVLCEVSHVGGKAMTALTHHGDSLVRPRLINNPINRVITVLDFVVVTSEISGACPFRLAVSTKILTNVNEILVRNFFRIEKCRRPNAVGGSAEDGGVFAPGLGLGKEDPSRQFYTVPHWNHGLVIGVVPAQLLNCQFLRIIPLFHSGENPVTVPIGPWISREEALRSGNIDKLVYLTARIAKKETGEKQKNADIHKNERHGEERNDITRESKHEFTGWLVRCALQNICPAIRPVGQQFFPECPPPSNSDIAASTSGQAQT